MPAGLQVKAEAAAVTAFRSSLRKLGDIYVRPHGGDMARYTVLCDGCTPWLAATLALLAVTYCSGTVVP